MGIAVTDKPRKESADDILSLPNRNLSLIESRPSQVEILDELFEPSLESDGPPYRSAMSEVRKEDCAPSFDESAPNEVMPLEASFHEEPLHQERPEVVFVEPPVESATSASEGDAQHETTQEYDERDHAPLIETMQPPRSDGYAVGLRLLRVSPIWLLFVSVGFFLVIFVMSWMSQPASHAEVAEKSPSRSNHATNTATLNVESAPAEHAVRDEGEKSAASAQGSAPVEVEKAATVEETAAMKMPPPPAQTKVEAVAEKGTGESAVENERAMDGRFTVQVASYENASDANERVSKLRAAGFEARTVSVELPRRGTWYRVHVGSFGGREDAARLVGRLKEAGATPDAFVTETNSR